MPASAMLSSPSGSTATCRGVEEYLLSGIEAEQISWIAPS